MKWLNDGSNALLPVSNSGTWEKNKKQTKNQKKKPSTKKKGQKALENIAKRADAVPLLLFLLFAAWVL